MQESVDFHSSTPGGDLPPVWPPSEDHLHKDTVQGVYYEDEGGLIFVVKPAKAAPVQIMYTTFEYERPEPPIQIPSIVSFEVAIPKDYSIKKLNVQYETLSSYLSAAYNMCDAKASGFVQECFDLLNTLMSQNIEFCNFFGDPSFQILEIQSLLNGSLKQYQSAFKSNNKKQVTSIFLDRKERGLMVETENNILGIFNDYQALIYKSRSIHVTTDSFSILSFRDGEGVVHQCTLKLYTQILCSKNFIYNPESTSLFKRKGGLRIDGGAPLIVRWTGASDYH